MEALLLGLNAVTLLVVLTTALLIFNKKVLKLHPTIGLMLSAVLTSIIFLAVNALGWIDATTHVTTLVDTMDFPNLLMNWVMPFLLFAGALKVNVAYLKSHRWAIGVLSTVGVLASSLMLGIMLWLTSFVMGLPLTFLHCWLLGSILMPTDPVVVSSLLKKLKVPRKLSAKISGESLFNDGVAVILFLALAGAVSGTHEVAGGVTGIHDLSFLQLLSLPFVEIGGAVIIGLILGQVACWLLHHNTDLIIELFITISLVLVAVLLTNGPTNALGLGPNMPLTVVIAGLFIGNHGRKTNKLTWENRAELSKIWEIIDEFLVTLLFVLMGMMLVIIKLSAVYIVAGLLTSIFVLIARYVAVTQTIKWLESRNMETFTEGSLPILVWGGMRGTISFAMVMMLPISPARDAMLAITFIVVALSIFVQGLTMESVIKKALPKATEEERAPKPKKEAKEANKKAED
jgi:CPA1 family monovalent cation:H+ antiporter